MFQCLFLVKSLLAMHSLYIEIYITVLPRHKSRAYTIFNPHVSKAISDSHFHDTVIYAYIVATSELVQKIYLDVNNSFISDFFASIETYTAYNTFASALTHSYFITDSIIIPSYAITIAANL